MISSIQLRARSEREKNSQHNNTSLRALKSFRNSASYELRLQYVAFDPFDGILNFAEDKKARKMKFHSILRGYWIFRVLNECVFNMWK